MPLNLNNVIDKLESFDPEVIDNRAMQVTVPATGECLRFVKSVQHLTEGVMFEGWQNTLENGVASPRVRKILTELKAYQSDGLGNLTCYIRNQDDPPDSGCDSDPEGTPVVDIENWSDVPIALGHAR